MVRWWFQNESEHYIERMAMRFNIDDSCKPVETPGMYGSKLTTDMCPKNDDEKLAAAKLPFQALVGGLIYVTKTRPDVAYQISDVARFMSNWGVEHLKHMVIFDFHDCHVVYDSNIIYI